MATISVKTKAGKFVKSFKNARYSVAGGKVYIWNEGPYTKGDKPLGAYPTKTHTWTSK